MRHRQRTELVFTTHSARKCPKVKLSLLFFVQTVCCLFILHAFVIRTFACKVSRVQRLSDYFVGFSF